MIDPLTCGEEWKEGGERGEELEEGGGGMRRGGGRGGRVFESNDELLR